MGGQRKASSRIVHVAISGVCLGILGASSPAAAQPQRLAAVDATAARSFAKVCGRTGRWSECFTAVRGFARGSLARVADAVLVELQAAPAPKVVAPPKTGPVSPAAKSRQWAILSTGAPPDPPVIWDGTFAHPDAPAFYILKGSVPPDVQTSEEACAQLPDPLKADKNLLVKLVCRAEQELLAAGPDRWPDESSEFERLRQRLAACLPPAANSNPCSAP
jgi:hypothetical protein